VVQRGLVLSGGGARGAYEVGVLAYICTQLPKIALNRRRFQILSGTSVGAIHAAYMAAAAHTSDYSIDKLMNIWRQFRLRKMLMLSTWDVLSLPLTLFDLFFSEEPRNGIFINSHYLNQLVCEDIPWAYVRSNLQDGWVESLTISATQVGSGKTVVFVDRPRLGLPVARSRDYRRIIRGVKLGPLHALASAAIPFFFPAVRIDGSYYCDGGLRQNTPLSPALRCGADRVLVISVGHGREDMVSSRSPTAIPEAYPRPQVLLGKVFNALLLDHLDYDLAQLRGINFLLEDGEKTFGQAFLENISKTSMRIRGQAYRHIEALVVRPSRDLGEMAADFVRENAFASTLLTEYILKILASEQNTTYNADLLSYLLFDGHFANRLIRLGMEDADSHRQSLIDFFKD
jgi:NTE family protein